MYHICKSKSGFMVVLVANNGEPLSTSQVLSSKQKAWGNVKSQLSVITTGDVRVQDDTLTEAKVYLYDWGGCKLETCNPSPKYVPGKNKKKLK
jgi:uncharacterized protein YegP (UPF0339 family)